MIRGPSATRSHFALVATDIDTAPVLAELEAARDRWLADTSRQRKVRCQRHTRNIFLRTALKPLPPGANNANDVHESREAREACRFPRTLALLRQLAEQEEGTLGRATLVALSPRRPVLPHVDAGAYYRVRDRYHLVLQSPSGSLLTAAGETVVMRERQLWVFNNKVPHAAENPSDTARVHLIFDLLPQAGAGHYVQAPAGGGTVATAAGGSG